MAVQEQDIQRFRAILSERFGLRLDDDGGLDHLGQVLSRRIASTASAGPAEYLDRITDVTLGREELRLLAGEISVGETFFFRYPDQFRALSDTVLPAVLREHGTSRPIRMLSAGCASGEEAYSLAIIAWEAVGSAAADRVSLVGVDISPPLLRAAAAARYSEWSMRSIPLEQRSKWFSAVGRDYLLHETIQRLVTYQERNLLDDDPEFWAPERFDIVFFRNVSIYFEPATTQEFIRRIARSMTPGGFLFLGPSETLRGVSHDFHLRHTHGAFYYQRLRRGESAKPVPAQNAPRGPQVEVGQANRDMSWVEAICRAADRIVALSDQHGRLCSSTAESPTPAESQVPSSAPCESLASAWELLRQERFGDALRALGELPVESEAGTEAMLLRAVLLSNHGKTAEAERVCAQILAADELDAGAHYVAAMCREHVGDRIGAVEHDRTSVYLDPNFAMPRLHLGLLAKRAGDLETARRELSEALTLLAAEDSSRILLFGGGFSRGALIQLCRTELRACRECS